MIISNLIIDGNYILNKNVFTLHKNNLLFGALYKSLEMSIMNYKKWFPFANVYLVSDSMEKSWRKNISKDYKAQRKRNSDIDWSFVMETYKEFKNDIKYRGVKVLEASNIEGDDWISFLINKSNLDGVSTIVVSNDHDIKQLIGFNINPLYVNIMTNEILNKQKIFLPKNYQMFLNEVNKLENNDIFNLNDNVDFLNLLNSFIEKYDVQEVDSVESLLVKLISGDQSDNISPIWQITSNGRKRGIGEKGAKWVYDSYLVEFGDISLDDPDFYENIADLVCEKKKLSKTTIPEIKTNIEKNMRLINLDISKLPDPVKNRMENEYSKI